MAKGLSALSLLTAFSLVYSYSAPASKSRHCDNLSHRFMKGNTPVKFHYKIEIPFPFPERRETIPFFNQTISDEA